MKNKRKYYNFSELIILIPSLAQYEGSYPNIESVSVVIDIIDDYAHNNGLKFDFIMTLKDENYIYVFSEK
jgi:hypothetical protein